MSYEGWLVFRAGEVVRNSLTLPCICCDRLVTEAESVPGTFGDVSCEDVEVGTVCRDPRCRDGSGIDDARN